MGSACWQHAAAPLREVFLIEQKQKKMHVFKTAAFSFYSMNSSGSLQGQAMEYLNEVCEQGATTCLKTTQTGCVPKHGTVNMALRGSEQLWHPGRGGVSSQGLVCPSKAAT